MKFGVGTTVRNVSNGEPEAVGPHAAWERHAWQR